MPTPVNRNILIGLVVVVIILAVAYMLYFQDEPYQGETEPQGAEGETPAGEEGEEVIEVTVSLYEWGISLSQTEFPVGTKIRFIVKNDGSFPHALTIQRDDIGFKESSATINGGQETIFEVVFTEPGTYEIYCPVGNHAQRGMVGQITVTG